MTRFIKWLAFYLLFVPASIIGYSGYMIIPDRKDVERMSLFKALSTVILIGGILVFALWALRLFMIQYV
jgi:hypothetical protein